ncbi:MAG TPA: FMN-binding protein [Jatrophihabitans sp.]|nr:FMN-binding protein [Jatrophihabitans sp.]
MRRIVLAVLGTVTGLVMLLSFKTHPASTASVPALVAPVTPTGSDPAGSPAPGTSATPGASTAPAAGSSAATAPASTHSAAPVSRTITGAAADTRYGPVQVQLTVGNGTVTAVNAVVYPQNTPRDYEINSYAIPLLNQEALSAKSAQIDMVSGATYTSEGYLQSLQSALDQAGL